MEWISQYSGQITAVAAVVTAVATVALVIPGVWAILSAKRDSRDRTRPVMVAELGHHHEDPMILIVIVRNAGPTVARNVRLTFNPELPNSEADRDRYAKYLRTMFGDVIPTVAPGQVFSNPWHTRDRDGVPGECTVTVRYEDTRGRKYEDSYLISIQPFLGALIVEASGSIRGLLKKLSEEARTQNRTLGQMNRILETLRRDDECARTPRPRSPRTGE